LMNPGGDNNHLAEAMDLQRAALVAGSLGSGLLLLARRPTSAPACPTSPSLAASASRLSPSTGPATTRSRLAVPSFNAFADFGLG
jgi:hypothetical protein